MNAVFNIIFEMNNVWNIWTQNIFHFFTSSILSFQFFKENDISFLNIIFFITIIYVMYLCFYSSKTIFLFFVFSLFWNEFVLFKLFFFCFSFRRISSQSSHYFPWIIPNHFPKVDKNLFVFFQYLKSWT